MESGDHEKAILALREAVAARPDLDWAHFSLGKCLYLTGEYPAALEALDGNLTVCRDELSHFHSWFFKAMVLERMGDRAGARRCLERARGYREYSGRCETPEEKTFLDTWKESD